MVPPNVLFIDVSFSSTPGRTDRRVISFPPPQGWADTSLQPDVTNPDIPTPNLKGLMNSGVRLGSYYTQTVCSPTRSSLMTGRFPFRMGMQHMTTIDPASTAHLPLDTPTLPEMLKAQSNYETHMIGKWHLGYA